MEIRKLHVDPPGVRPPLAPPGPASRESTASGSTDANRAERAAAAQPHTGYDVQLNDLVARVRDLPDVRPEVVEAARSLLTSGELLTRDAAERTAEKIPTRGAPFGTHA